jgi:DNA polymerase-3 subunit epsilon
MHEGQVMLRKLYEAHSIEPTELLEEPSAYNARILKAVEHLQSELPTFALIDRSFQNDSNVCLLIEQGRFYGMGYLPLDLQLFNVEECKTYLTPYPDSDYTRGLVYTHVSANPEKKLILTS